MIDARWTSEGGVSVCQAHVYDRDAVAITRGGIAVVMHHRPPLDWRTSTTGEMLR